MIRSVRFLAVLLLVPALGQAKEWDLAAGQTVYKNNCVACHGASGDGRGPASVAIPNPKPRNFIADKFKFGDSKEQIFATITKGIEGTAMPGWTGLSVEERQSVSAYVASLRKK